MKFMKLQILMVSVCLFLSNVHAAEIVLNKDATFDLNFKIRSDYVSDSTATNNLVGQSFNVNCALWKERATMYVTFPADSSPAPGRFYSSAAESATCEQPQALDKEGHQLEAIGTLSFNLKFHLRYWSTRTKAVVLEEDISQTMLTGDDLFTGRSQYQNNCFAWQNDVDTYSKAVAVYTNCEVPQVKFGCCGSLNVLGTATVVLLTKKETTFISDKLETLVLDTGDFIADRNAALEEIELMKAQWKNKAKANYGTTLAYMYCTPNRQGKTRIQLSSECHVLTHSN